MAEIGPGTSHSVTGYREGGGSGAGAAGDVQHLAGDEAGARGAEEGDGVGDVLGPAGTVHRDAGDAGGAELLEGLPDALGGGLGHLGDDEPGRDRVTRDAELAELVGDGLGEALEAGLGGG